jgi:hypothetical protein
MCRRQERRLEPRGDASVKNAVSMVPTRCTVIGTRAARAAFLISAPSSAARVCVLLRIAPPGHGAGPDTKVLAQKAKELCS